MHRTPRCGARRSARSRLNDKLSHRRDRVMAQAVASSPRRSRAPRVIRAGLQPQSRALARIHRKIPCGPRPGTLRLPGSICRDQQRDRAGIPSKRRKSRRATSSRSMWACVRGLFTDALRPSRWGRCRLNRVGWGSDEQGSRKDHAARPGITLRLAPRCREWWGAASAS